MHQDYILPDPWCIIEEGFDPKRVTRSESIFSLGNGTHGGRATFEELYSGESFQGSYIGGVYYPDKTKVGWWKNGYPEYFAKVLNAPSWIGINVYINGEPLDLNTCATVRYFRRELNMKEGIYRRTFVVVLHNGVEVAVKVTRFLSLSHDDLGAIRYEVTPLIAPKGEAVAIRFEPYLDSGITNHDSNWEEHFWETDETKLTGQRAFITTHTKKTDFKVVIFQRTEVWSGEETIIKPHHTDTYISLNYLTQVSVGDTVYLEKFGGYVSSFKYGDTDLLTIAKERVQAVVNLGFDGLLAQQQHDWAAIWERADITIEGDVKAQQAIRFNIFQLNQTYLGGKGLNIGPKGFTGEKYGGSTYWDTEAYCMPFYTATKNEVVARQLLEYRYNQLPQAIANAEKLGFTGGAALYPMVTMNGEECHNEWEITFEEIHRNGAIAYAIDRYVRYTGDREYLREKGIDVLVGIARFWAQRVNFSEEKQRYVILGVTGPNEYENNVNNNFYTNYIAAWCLRYASFELRALSFEESEVRERLGVTEKEVQGWLRIAEEMYYPYSEKYGVYLQQEGFLDKELKPASVIPTEQRPINQHWSWDRILRSPYIKQADTLQGFYFFEDDFSEEALRRHYEFYEPFTVHESSLSPCVHSILAARLGKEDDAYWLYLRTARLDLDDYNHEVHEGLHITSMAGTWMSVVEGFGGMRVKDGKLHFAPILPKEWQGYSFKINFRNQILKIEIRGQRSEGREQRSETRGQRPEVSFEVDKGTLEVVLYGEVVKVEAKSN